MNETVFFNPGDSIGNFHDHNEAVKTAQIFKEKQAPTSNILVVHGANNQTFDIFLANDEMTHQSEVTNNSYTVVNKL